MQEEKLQPATLMLIGVNIVVFAMESFAGGSADTAIALRFGAQFTPLILSGEWWRLFTAMFLHFGTGHLVSNMVTLFLFGNAVERLLGHGRMLMIYLASGLCGNLLFLIWELMRGTATLSAGASGAIFGLVGVYAAMALIPEMRRFVSVRNVVIMLILNFAYGADSGSINLVAHAGGILCGTVMGYVMLRSRLRESGRSGRISH